MTETISWPWLAVGTLVIAAFGGIVAERKTSFELFGRRFDAYEAVNAAINARIAEIQTTELVHTAKFEALQELWSTRRPMRFLFPPHVDERLERIQQALLDYAVARAAVLAQRDGGPNTGAIGPYMDAFTVVRDLQDSLLNDVTPSLRQATATEWLWRWPAHLFRSWTARKGKKS